MRCLALILILTAACGPAHITVRGPVAIDTADQRAPEHKVSPEKRAEAKDEPLLQPEIEPLTPPPASLPLPSRDEPIESPEGTETAPEPIALPEPDPEPVITPEPIVTAPAKPVIYRERCVGTYQGFSSTVDIKAFSDRSWAFTVTHSDGQTVRSWSFTRPDNPAHWPTNVKTEMTADDKAYFAIAGATHFSVTRRPDLRTQVDTYYIQFVLFSERGEGSASTSKMPNASACKPVAL